MINIVISGVGTIIFLSLIFWLPSKLPHDPWDCRGVQMLVDAVVIAMMAALAFEGLAYSAVYTIMWLIQ